MIYHITTPLALSQNNDNEHITHESLSIEGFIHCSTAAQVVGVLERYFESIDTIVILSIDEKLLSSPLKYEIATNDEAFPHIFGTINRKAIIEEKTFHRQNGVFSGLEFFLN